MAGKPGIHLIAKGDRNDSQKVLITVKITTKETKEVTHEKYIFSV